MFEIIPNHGSNQYRAIHKIEKYMLKSSKIGAKCFVLAAGATLTLWTAWGFGETYAAAPHIPAWLIYPFFWAVFALVSPFVRTSD